MEERTLPRQETIIQEKDKRGNVINKYVKGRYLGKGGFAKCHEFIHCLTGRRFAAKIIDKSTLVRSKAKQKLASQIEIHKSVKSQFVVKYQKNFEDANNVYILLEICTNQTMNELVKRRKKISEIEARYYLKQIALAMKDFQEQLIIHRDLKLGNLLLTQNLEIRISDFGLAAKLGHRNQRRKTMCGTPNYIAPEILQNHTNSGHSYQVDVWSLGVIAYACLVGRPPFETNDVKTTYNRIKMCNYSFPDHVSLSTTTKHFISKLLQKDPKHRLTVDEILADQFFALPIPESLPSTLMACPPNRAFIDRYHVQDPALKERDSNTSVQKTDRGLEKGESVRSLARTNSINELNRNTNYGQRAASTATLTRGRMLSSRADLHKPVEKKVTVPAQTAPYVWITFFEQNVKFGMAYLLNSNAIGMRFNDSTTIVSNNQFQKMKYIDFIAKNQAVNDVFEITNVPSHLHKKNKIISYYQKELKGKKESYESGLNNDQIIMREKQKFKENSETAMAAWVTKYSRTSKATLFWFNNKDYQTIFQDFTELLFSKDNITYVNKMGERIYFKKDNIESQSDEIKKRVKYVNNIVQNIKDSSKNSQKEKENHGSMENKPDVAQSAVQKHTIVRSSSMLKMQKVQPSTLRGSASTSRISGSTRIMRY